MNENEKMVFTDHYDSLAEEEKVTIRNQFCEMSGAAYSSFYQKKKKNTFTRLEQKALETICQTSFTW